MTTGKLHIDILTARFVRNPHWFDVVAGSELFGDILSDLAFPMGQVNFDRLLASVGSHPRSLPTLHARPQRRLHLGREVDESHPPGEFEPKFLAIAFHALFLAVEHGSVYK